MSRARTQKTAAVFPTGFLIQIMKGLLLLQTINEKIISVLRSIFFEVYILVERFIGLCVRTLLTAVFLGFTGGYRAREKVSPGPA